MLEEGLEGSVETAVTGEMTARALGSGDVPVLATPVVVAMAERAASHVAPTRVGSRISATARLVEIDGRKLSFDVWVADPAGEIARGHHRRVVVDRQAFLAAASDRPKG